MYYNLWIACLILGFLLLSLAIVLTFLLHIPDLLDELSGRKAKRQIKRLKELNLGTGALDRTGATDDFYQSISSGSLLAEDIVQVEQSISMPVEKVTKSPIKVKQVFSEFQYNQNEDDNDIGTTDMSGDELEATGYMEEEATSYVDDSDVTNILSGVESFSSTHHTVSIIEEQSSI